MEWMWVGFAAYGLLALVVVLVLAFMVRAVFRFVRRVVHDSR